MGAVVGGGGGDTVEGGFGGGQGIFGDREGGVHGGAKHIRHT